MSSLLATLVLIVVALVGARFSFSTERVPPGPRLIFRTGTHFLLVGFALGPAGLGLLRTEDAQGLFPFLALGLGWVGLHFGLQLHLGTLRGFAPRAFLLAFGQGILTFGIFTAVSFAIARGSGFEAEVLPILVLGAACTAAVTTPTGIGMVSSIFAARGKVRDLVFFIASLDALIGILALQVVQALYLGGTGPRASLDPADLAWVAAAVGVGAVCGLVFVLVSRHRPTSEELVLYLLGISAFSSGVALHLGLSPLFVAVVMGAVVANSGPSGRRVLRFLERWEQIVYVAFLLVAGALLEFPTWLVLPIAVGYAVVRFGGKVVAAGVLVSALRMAPAIPRRLGLGLIPQGGISIAMAVSALLVFSELEIAGHDAAAVLFSVIVLGVVLSELVGPLLTLSLLVRAGEVRSVPDRTAGRRPSSGAAAHAGGDGGRDGGAPGD